MDSRAKVAATVYAEDRDDAVFKWPGGWRLANRPFSFKWDAAASPEGWYRLVLSGYFENNSQVGKTVHFYHRPDLLTRPPGR